MLLALALINNPPIFMLLKSLDLFSSYVH
jgi:hypothetical protein